MYFPKILTLISLSGLSFLVIPFFENTQKSEELNSHLSYVGKQEVRMMIESTEFKSISMDGLLGIEIQNRQNIEDNVTYEDLYDPDELIDITMDQGYVIRPTYLAIDPASSFWSFIIQFSVFEKDISIDEIKRNSSNFIRTFVLPLTLETDSCLEFVEYIEPTSFELSKGKYRLVVTHRDIDKEQAQQWYPDIQDENLWDTVSNGTPQYVQIRLYKTDEIFDPVVF